MSGYELLDDERLTRDEAASRAELIDITRYTIELDLSNAMNLEDETYGVTTTIRFSAKTPGADTFLNYLGAQVDSVMLNDHALTVEEVAGTARIVLPNLAPDNTVVVTSRSWYSHSGEGLHRFVDPSDGQVYVYSQFEPADARRVYPNMEQPDLKAAFDISMIGPETWTLASNAHETSREPWHDGFIRVHFAPTKPISTYLTTFLAGPYAQFDDSWPGHHSTGAAPIALRIFARQSLAEHVDAQRLFDLTKQGLAWFHDEFDFPYPWGKYDQAFVPEYNLGAMENPGLVTFNESYIFTSRATTSQYMQRATTLMHEMSHMWFGNLVTMRWWDDLWLKESFADFYGSKAVAEATSIPGAWQSFAHQRKAWAYVQDSYPTTHPIVADIIDLEAARQNFDGITYAKGAAVIKQLYHYVGEQTFVQACRQYFSRFAYGTAQLQDFLAILEEASGRDMQTWSRDWLQTSGPATLSASVADNGKITVHQEAQDPLTGDRILRPHALHVAIFSLNEHQHLVQTAATPIDLPAGTSSIELQDISRGSSDVQAIIVNQHDQTYAQVEFDAQTLEAVTTYPVIDHESTAVATVWSSLWTMVRQARFPAGDFIRAAATLAHTIDDVSMHARVLHQAVTALKEFAPPSQRTQLTKQLSSSLLDALVTLDAGSDRQRSAARAFTQLGHKTASLAGELTYLLAGDQTSELSPGLVIDDEMKWLLLISLASVGRIDKQRLDDELSSSHTAQNELYHRTAVAALADSVQYDRLWDHVLQGHDKAGKTLSNAQVTATAEGLLIAAPADDRARLQRVLDNIRNIWESRSNNLATRTINGLFPLRHSPVTGGMSTQMKHPAVVSIEAWLTQHADAPAALRRIVIERRSDILDRLKAQNLKQGSR